MIFLVWFYQLSNPNVVWLNQLNRLQAGLINMAMPMATWL